MQKEQLTEKNDSLLQQMLKVRFIMAPLAGITDIPFRLLVRSFGCGFAFTEMVDVNGLHYKNRKTFDLIERLAIDTPLAAQIVGRDIVKSQEAAKILQDKGFGLIDLNCGCPARKVVGAGKGAALLKEPVYLAKLLKKLRKTVKVPLTVKMRSGWQQHDHHKLVRIFNDEGVDAICVHPRTRAQGFKGQCDRDITRQVKSVSKVPVFCSGGLFTPDEVLRSIEETRTDGAYIARGALGKPWIFRQISDIINGKQPFEPDFKEKKEIILEHFMLSMRFHGLQRTFKRMHKHLGWYLKGFKNLHEILCSYRDNRDLEEFKGWLFDLEPTSDGKKLILKKE